MAATSHTVVAGPPERAQRDGRPFLWLLSLICLSPIVWQGLIHASAIRLDLFDLLPWLILIALVSLLPVHVWQHTTFAPDTVVKVAAMLVLQPAEVGVLSFVAGFDPREFNGHITLTKAAFNRSQIALNAFAGSLAVHSVTREPASSRYVLGLGVLSLLVWLASNYLLVGSALSFDRGYSFREVIPQLRLGTIADFVETLTLWAVLGAVLAALYDESRPLALLAILAATFLGRQALARSQMLVDTSRAYRSREQALKHVSQQITRERSDERRLIAAELHDEVLQPLFKVTLMAQVLKNDLATGRLLELDQDLPELLTGAELASTTLRELIGDLRRSSLGRGGLEPALARFIQSVAERTPCKIHSAIDTVEVDPDVELIIYQIAKEAVTNALAHSRGRNIWVSLNQEEGFANLTVRDDGAGFSPASIPEGHYGVHIMRERAAAAGADLLLESSPGHGAKVTLTVFRATDQG